MASSVGFGTVAPAAASPAGRSLGRLAARPPTARTVPAATKAVAAAAAKAEEKGLFDAIFGALYKEEQLLETDPILNKVESRAPAPRKAAGKPAAGQSGGSGGFSLGGLFPKKE